MTLMENLDLSERLILSALMLNFMTLCVVIYQARLNKRSLETTKQSMELSLKERYIENLPESNSIIFVNMKLTEWRENLIQIKPLLKKSMRRLDDKLIDLISKKGLVSPKGLVRKFYYNNASPWLSTMYITGAQYYYDCMAPITYLCNKQKPDYISGSLIERVADSIKHISELLCFIKDIVPESYLECPASVKDESFFDA